MNIAILGACWGDEGKGRVTHSFSRRFDWVIRFNGGANAGHTIYRDDKKCIHNLLPSFDWRVPSLKCYLASGMVIDLEQLFKEVEEAETSASTSWGYQLGDIARRVYVDPDAFVVLPCHKEEDIKTNGHIGSTNRGIGPAYRDKIARKGKRVLDLLKENEYWVTRLVNAGVQFKHVLELKNQFEQENLLFEGAQGIMLDINHGCYPFVSCSDSTVSGIYSSGFNFIKLDDVFGVTKCYLTKVGEGPFPTELTTQGGDELRKLGNEYGATTGRPRRIGWLDLPALNYACQKGGIKSLVVTKLDILNTREEVPICVAYKTPPVCSADFFDAKPQFITLPGWKDPKDRVQIKPLLDCIRNFTGCPVKCISCGVKETDIVTMF